MNAVEGKPIASVEELTVPSLGLVWKRVWRFESPPWTKKPKKERKRGH